MLHKQTCLDMYVYFKIAQFIIHALLLDLKSAFVLMHLLGHFYNGKFSEESRNLR